MIRAITDTNDINFDLPFLQAYLNKFDDTIGDSDVWNRTLMSEIGTTIKTIKVVDRDANG